MDCLLALSHSFVRRLCLEEVDEGIDLGAIYERVDIRGVGGMWVSAIRRLIEYVRRTRPTVIYLDKGTNDLRFMLGNGVHLNKMGMGHYRKQIRQCVRHYVNK